MSAKWTAGPWRVDPKRALRVIAAKDTTVASTGTCDSIRDEWEMNAHLIAAAPELYAALKAIVDAQSLVASVRQSDEYIAACAIARDTLARARGEA